MPSTPPVLKTCDVTITRVGPNTGNSGPNLTYKVEYDTDSLAVDTTNTILCYRLTADTPSTIVFTGMATDVAGVGSQFSPYSISVDGRMLTFTDFDSLRENLNLTFTWMDGVSFSHDPQVGNTPQT